LIPYFFENYENCLEKFLLTVLLVFCWAAVFSNDEGDSLRNVVWFCGRCRMGSSSSWGEGIVLLPVPIDESIMILVAALVFGIISFTGIT
jgi:hypothetical protein